MEKINYHSDFKIHKHKTDEIFDEANHNFKLVKRSGQKKFQYLDKWTYKKSRHLINEINFPKANKKVYKRGAIIYVDFGVNIGGEFSGPHFAIVLNKKDNKANEKITVVPLTSHLHDHTVKLSNTVTENSIQYLENSLNELSEFLISQLILATRAKNALTGQQLSFKKILDQIKTNFGNGMKERLDSIQIDSFKDSELLMKKFINMREGIAISKISNDKISEYTLGEKNNDIDNEVKDYKKVVDKYLTYNKDTYARIEDVTTISKRRIRKINRFDPIGKIKASTSTLDIIDENLKELFVGKNID